MAVFFREFFRKFFLIFENFEIFIDIFAIKRKGS